MNIILKRQHSGELGFANNGTPGEKKSDTEGPKKTLAGDHSYTDHPGYHFYCFLCSPEKSGSLKLFVLPYHPPPKA